MKRRIVFLSTAILLLPSVSVLQAAKMYAVTASPGQLWTVDTSTAETTVIGGLPFSACLTVAYDIDENRIYTFDNASNQLYSIDPNNGSGFAVGTLPYDFVHGFAYDAINDILYGHDINTGAFFSINTSDASTTFIGNTGFGYVGGIDYDPINGILYGLEAFDSTGTGPRLFTINPATGATTVLGVVTGLASRTQWSLGFNPEDGMLYTSTDLPYDFVRINPSTLATTTIGTTTARLGGLASMVVPEPTAVCLLVIGGLLTRRRREHQG